MAQIRAKLGDSYQIYLSDDAIENSIQRYQTMLAAQEQAPKILAEEYRDVDDLALCIDGLLPEKGHERRIHGHHHAGVRIVQEGPTLVLVLDAHLRHPRVFTHQQLRPYAKEKPPACQRDAIQRRVIMRKARSKKTLPQLLQNLEQRCI